MNSEYDMRWLHRLLSAIVVLLAMIAVELSVFIGPIDRTARANIPDGGLQLLQLIESQKQTTSKLDAILKHLQTQTIKVEVASTDKDSGTKTVPKPRAGTPSAPPKPAGPGAGASPRPSAP